MSLIALFSQVFIHDCFHLAEQTKRMGRKMKRGQESRKRVRAGAEPAKPGLNSASGFNIVTHEITNRDVLCALPKTSSPTSKFDSLFLPLFPEVSTDLKLQRLHSEIKISLKIDNAVSGTAPPSP